MCPSMPTPHYGGVPVRRVQGRRPVRPRRRGLFRGDPPADDLGRHDRLDQRPDAWRPDRRQQPAEFIVRFVSTGSAVLLAWGGHLAQSRFWNMAGGGERDGAGEVSGSPWHMRTLQLDGSGNRNQDRSIQPSAIVGELPPRALAPPTPTPRPPTTRAVVTPPPTNGWWWRARRSAGTDGPADLDRGRPGLAGTRHPLGRRGTARLACVRWVRHRPRAGTRAKPPRLTPIPREL